MKVDDLVTIDGETRTVKEWCEVNGLYLQLVIARTNLGWSPKKALTTPITPRRKQKRDTSFSRQLVTIGRTTKSVLDWSKHYGIAMNTVYMRAQRYGWDLKDAVSKPERGYTHRIKPGNLPRPRDVAAEQAAERIPWMSRLVTIHGETRQVREWCGMYGVSRHCAYQRFYTLKWPIAKAVTTPMQEKHHAVEPELRA